MDTPLPAAPRSLTQRLGIAILVPGAMAVPNELVLSRANRALRALRAGADHFFDKSTEFERVAELVAERASRRRPS